ncbi:MAG: PTS fructose transporter subunit IIA [Betaproteobacteria bacterium]|nr:PTS fructose transporter subunit IIA [Betaproteobacteria bacterium]
MAGLLIIAHAPLATALKSCASHVWPTLPARLEALDVRPDASVPDSVEEAQALLARVVDAQGVLVLTDVFGATPCNVAQRLAAPSVRIVTGVNLPMLLRAVSYAQEPLELLTQRATAGGTTGIMQLAYTAPQQQTLKATNDPTGHHHQQ